MWYKVHELNQKDYSKSRISRETGLDRTTVRRYLQMTENEFHNWISNPRKMPLKQWRPSFSKIWRLFFAVYRPEKT